MALVHGIPFSSWWTYRSTFFKSHVTCRCKCQEEGEEPYDSVSPEIWGGILISKGGGLSRWRVTSLSLTVYSHLACTSSLPKSSSTLHVWKCLQEPNLKYYANSTMHNTNMLFWRKCNIFYLSFTTVLYGAR